MEIVKSPYVPYPHQRGLWKAFFEGKKRFFIVRSRRGGKDRDCFEIMWRAAMMRPGNYIYVFPELKQAKIALWSAIDDTGQRIFDYIPKELLYKAPNHTDMRLTFVHPDDPRKEGSTIQVLGATEHGNKLRGGNYAGVVLSEFAFMDPAVYPTLASSLLRSKGWCLMNTTVFGHNHAFDLYNSVVNSEDWYVENTPVYKCFNHDGKHLISAEDLKKEVDSGAFSEAKFRQEFLNDWDSAIEGAIFTRELSHAEQQGRLAEFTIVPGVPVSVFMDIGVNAKTGVTALWFCQFPKDGRMIFLDLFCDSDQPAEYYVNYIKDWRARWGATIYKTFLPHDANQRDKIYCDTYTKRYRALGMDVEVVPRIKSKMDAIELTRKYFRNYHINTKLCQRGIQALREYRGELLGKAHWCHHPVDAFLAIGQACELGRLPNTGVKTTPTQTHLNPASHGGDAWGGASHTQFEKPFIPR